MGGENLSPDILSLPSQLPYLIDGQTKLTQSNAILRYIARKHKMGEYRCESKACLHGEVDRTSSSGVGP